MAAEDAAAFFHFPFRGLRDGPAAAIVLVGPLFRAAGNAAGQERQSFARRQGSVDLGRFFIDDFKCTQTIDAQRDVDQPVAEAEIEQCPALIRQTTAHQIFRH
ncbi:hypothetical protein J3R73_001998 [Labrys monachus]|uniref:Uncharacterized protein n=1 Tax=Labrys monachus TaxID=217067 RepID=A0ABU0FCP2_9HYPH|nr:hypothetical protein [Labrys monachus]